MSKKSPVNSTTSYNISEQERAARDQMLTRMSGLATEILGTTGANAADLRGLADKNAAAVNPTYESYLTGGAGESAWKKGQLLNRTSSTTRSFNDAAASTRRRAAMSGFGYEQPGEQGAESDVDIARAQALSRIPGDVEAEYVPIAMSAAQGRMASGAQQAGTYGQAFNTQLAGFGQAGGLYSDIAGQYSPEQYYGTAAQQAEQEKARRGGLWKNLAMFGTAIGAAPFTGGASLGILGGSR